MTTEEGLQAFTLAYNASLLDAKPRATVFPEPWLRLDPPEKDIKSSAAKKAQKRKRKQAEQAKKRNRKRGK